MKTIVLKKLTLTNFAGVQSFVFEPDGKNCTVKAQNKSGKTTLYNAFLWPPFNKNADGDTKFGNRPFDENHDPIRNLSVSSEIVLGLSGFGDIDGDVTLKKTEVEKLVKRKFDGFTSKYEINGEDKLKKDFDAFVDSIIKEDVFRMLTDTDYFNGKLHHAERRKFLIGLVGIIPTPQEFEELLDEMTGRSFEGHRKIQIKDRKLLEDELKEINPRIDELQRGCKGYATEINTNEIDGKRNAVKMKIGQLDAKRKTLFDAEQERQTTIEQINSLKQQQIARERVLVTDTSGVTGLVQEKAEMQTAMNNINSDILQQQNSLKSYVGDRDRAINILNGIVSIRDQADVDIAAKVAKLTEAIENVVDTCPTCDRPLEESKIAEAVEAVKAEIETAKAESKESIEAIQKDGNEAVADIKLAKTCIENVEANIQNLSAKLEKTEAANATRIKEIDRLIHRNEPSSKENDTDWKVLAVKIQGFEEKLGDSVSDVLQLIDTERTDLLEDVVAFDKTLASGDRLTEDKKKIDDYQLREIELAQLIANIDNTLDKMGEYEKQESLMIEKAVNDRFEHVKFKLFKKRINGGFDPDCYVTLNGSSDLSTGEKIFAGIDCINTFSKHFDILPPLFIDNAESVTESNMPIVYKGQVIKLQAAEGVKELVIVAA